MFPSFSRGVIIMSAVRLHMFCFNRKLFLNTLAEMHECWAERDFLNYEEIMQFIVSFAREEKV